MRLNADLQFVDENEVLIPEEELFSGTNRDVVFNIILQHENALEIIKTLEESRVAQRWIRWSQIWTALFNRDYPDAFNMAAISEDGTITMNVNTRQILDGMSQQPNRPHTYWKRYYEYMTRIANITGLPRGTLGPNRAAPGVNFAIMPVFSIVTAEIHNLNVHTFPLGVTRNNLGADAYVYRIKLARHIDRMQPIVYLFFHRFSTIYDRTISFSKSRTPVLMVQLNLAAGVLLENRITYIPYDQTVLGTRIHFDYPESIAWFSPDGFDYYYFSSQNMYFQHRRIQPAVPNQTLVSSPLGCTQCSQPVATMSCNICGNLCATCVNKH